MSKLVLERIALELLEYKVRDLQSKVEGGSERAWALHDHLAKNQGPLTASEKQRFNETSLKLKRLSGVKKQQQVFSFDDIELDGGGGTSSSQSFDDAIDFSFDAEAAPEAAEAPATPKRTLPEVELTPEEREEQAILSKLAERAWWEGLGTVMQNLATTYRAEPERHTVRILYALLRNLGQYARTETFAHDLTLAHLTVKESVPDYTDPLISLNDVESIGELIREIAEVALSLKSQRSPYQALNISEDQVLSYLRRFGLAVARDPYAGKLALSQPRGPSSAQLRVALEELKKEQMREDTKQEQQRRLEARLQQALELERSQRKFFEQNVAQYMEAVETFFDELEIHLPRRVGGRAEWPTLAGKVLFAENPAVRTDKVPTGAKSLTVKLKGPTRLKLSGVDIALLSSGRDWALYVENDEIRLESEMKLRVDPGRLLIFREKDYIHFEVRDEGLSLAALVAEALMVHTLLERYGDVAKPVKMATGVDIGESQETAQQAFRRLQAIVGNAPDPGQALSGLLQGAARALQQNVPQEPLEQLASRFEQALTVTKDDLASLLEDWQHARVTLSSDPVSIKLAGFPFTARKYIGRNPTVPENVVLMAPGRPLGSFFDYLLLPFRDGTLICARAKNDLAALYIPPSTVSEHRSR